MEPREGEARVELDDREVEGLAAFDECVADRVDGAFAAESAVFTTAFARRGLNAEYGSSWLLPRIIGRARASEWLLSARCVDAAEAERMGLVNWVVPDAELMPRVLDYADDLAANCSPVAMAQAKQQIHEGWTSDRVEAERRAKELGHGPGGRVDFEEGVRSFVERRPPQFAPGPAPARRAPRRRRRSPAGGARGPHDAG